MSTRIFGSFLFMLLRGIHGLRGIGEFSKIVTVMWKTFGHMFAALWVYGLKLLRFLIPWIIFYFV